MIMTVDELKQFISADKPDAVLEAMLQALEMAIRGYTNNNFQDRGYRRSADIVGGVLYMEAPPPFAEGDTVQISQSELNNGLYTVKKVDDSSVEVNESVTDEDTVLLTRVSYPADVKFGAAKLIQWDLENGDKVGVQSETISRHSVTYFNLDGDNSIMGYPKSLTGFLKPYRKVRC